MSAFMRTAAVVEQAQEVEREFVAGTDIHHDTLVELAWAHTFLNMYGENTTGTYGMWL